MKVRLVFSSLLLSFAVAATAQAFPIAPAGTECLPVVVSANAPVVATYQGNSAGYSNDLYLMLDAAGQPGDDGNLANDLFIFNNHLTPVGTQMTLGTFPVGTELIFRLHVNNTGNNWYTGPATRNADGMCHARVLGNWNPNETLVSFEDLYGTPEGTNGFNDLSFSFTNTSPCLNNTAPVLSIDPGCGQQLTVTAGTPVQFNIQTSDADGDVVTLDVSGGLPGGATVSPALPTTSSAAQFAWNPTSADAGAHFVKFFASDNCVTVTCLIELDVIANLPPDCSNATASVLSLWPPNHVLDPVTINGVTDPDGDPVTIVVTQVTQDEPTNTTGDGDTCPDAVIDEDGNASIRAERSGLGNGRVYEITFTASDGRGGSCTGTAQVCVPHDKGKGSQCVNDGQNYASTQCSDAPVQSGGGTLATGSFDVHVSESNSSVRTIQYILPSESDVQLEAFDVLGRRVATLETSRQGAGQHQVTWDTSSLHGGMYFLRLRAGDVTLKRAVVVVN